MRIAVFGGGMAGSSAALFLKKDGHDVTLFEREANPAPLGAGIMLQRPGIHILKKLGFEDVLKVHTRPIHSFQGEIYNEKQIYNFDFLELGSDYFGLGMQRGTLFEMLFNSLEKSGVKVIKGVEIDKVNFKNNKPFFFDTNQNEYADFDLFIVANGSRSKFREQFGNCVSSKKQPYSAIWAKLPLVKEDLKDRILQLYKGRDLMGFMPIGSDPFTHNNTEIINFFWAVSSQINPVTNDLEFKKWKEFLLKEFSIYADQIELLESKEQLMFSNYFDAQVDPLYYKNIVFIGDAAHAMSPQLSAGTNLALLDSYCLAKAIAKESILEKSLSSFSIERTKQHAFYLQISRLITPIFQSPKNLNLIRDKILPQFYNLGFTKNIILETITGMKTGLFSTIDDRDLDI